MSVCYYISLYSFILNNPKIGLIQNRGQRKKNNNPNTIEYITSDLSFSLSRRILLFNWLESPGDQGLKLLCFRKKCD